MNISTMTDKRRAAYRMGVAILTVNALADNIHNNRGLYSGGMVPNLTSVQEVLSIPFDVLVQQVKMFPQVAPGDDLVDSLEKVV
jgi:hypothetical protein